MAIGFFDSININSSIPLDYRSVYQSDGLSATYPSNTNNFSVYSGMHTFDVTTKKEYICFVNLVNNKKVKTWYDINPDLYYIVSLGENDTLESGLTSLNGKITNTTPLAVIGSIIDQDNTVYKYVYNGTEFIPFSSIGNIGTGGGGESGGGSSTGNEPEQTIINNITNNYISTVILNFNAEDGFNDINEITSEALTSKYLTATEKQNVEPGTVIDVVYTGDNHEYFRSYVYVNDVWNIKCGTQEVAIELPCYQNWNEWAVPSEYTQGNNDLVWIEKIDGSNGKVVAYVRNLFGIQFINAQVFKKQEDTDLNNDNINDYYEQQLLTAIGCVNMSNVGYCVRVELAVNESEDINAKDKFTVLLQR